MALAETANLVVKLSLAGNYGRQVKAAQSSFGKLGATLQKTEGRAYKAGQQIGTGIKRAAGLAAVGVGILSSQVYMGLQSLIKLEEATAQTDAVIKSTGGTAGITASKVRELAESYEALNATVGDETIQAGENLLLTFTQVGKEAFEPALRAALDLSTALGTDLDSAITTVGKALSDPAKAMAKLRRQGIVLTKAEEKQIQAHLDNNDALGAQQVILAALDKRYGGSFLAKGQTTAGKVAKFTDSIEDLQRALAGALLPAIGNVADELTKFLSDPQTVRDFEELGREIGKLFSPENIRNGISALKDGFNFLKGVAGPIADVIGTAVRAFTNLPPDIQKLLVGGFAANKLTGGLVTNIAGGIFGALKAMTVQAAVVNVNGGVVNGGGIPGAGGAGGSGALGLLGATGIAAAIVAAAVPIGEAFASALPPWLKGQGLPGGTGASQSQQAHARAEAAMGRGAQPQDRPSGVGPAEVTKEIKASKVETVRETKKGFAFLDGKVSDLNRKLVAKGEQTKVATDKVKTATTETKRETAKGAALMSATTRSTTSSQTGAIVGAIWAAQPHITVNVTGNSVSSSNTRRGRYGSQTGSRNADWTDYGRGGVH